MKTQEPIQKKPEQDTLVSVASALGRYVKTHQKAVTAAVVILVLALVLGTTYHKHVKKVQQESWAAYYKAQLSVLKDPANVADLDNVGKAFPNSPAAQYAQLLKGDILYTAENYAQAADAYETLLASSNTTLRTAGVLSLAAARQATGNYEGAIKLLTDFISKNPTSFALPQAYFTLAMSQELAGHTSQAQETYQQISANYAKTYFGAVAKDKLTARKGQ